MPEFYTKRSDISAYGLACGYVQYWANRKAGEARETRVTLYREHDTYFVRAFDHERMCELSMKGFPMGHLKEARKEYRATIRRIITEGEFYNESGKRLLARA